MAPVAPPSDRILASSNNPLEAAELLQNLSLNSPKKSIQIPEPTKKNPAGQYVPVDAVGNGGNKPVERSVSPFVDPAMFYNPNGTFRQDYMDPSLWYNPNGYPSQTYYYGGNEWANPDGVEMSPGVYGDYQHSYGYVPYGAYSPSGSTMGHDGQLYGAQHYQYPTSYFQPSTTSNSGSYTPNHAATSQAEVASSVGAKQLQLSMDTAKGNQSSIDNVITNRTNVSKPLSSNNQNSTTKSNGFYGSGGLPPASSVSSAVLQGNHATAARNKNMRPFPHLMGLQHPRATSGLGQAGFMNQMYPTNRAYGQYASSYRSGPGFMPSSYYPRINGRGWLNVDNKYRSRGRGTYGYNREAVDGLNELNKGPRAKGLKDQKDSKPITLAVEGQSLPLRVNTDEDNLLLFPDREQYNKDDFPETYSDAKFFVIKSYSEDDVHKSIKYGVWTSTPNGNKKLDAAYKEAQEKSGGCPVFLLFSVNASGQFVGLAEMVGAVDFNRTVEYWQQDKWSGCFPLKWHVIKDLPNSMLRHITLENNENKPVTNSRDTQEVKFEQGIQILKIFRSHSSNTCILDDFEFYEGRQKVMQEKKAHQRQSNKQFGNVKLFDAASTENGVKEELAGKQTKNNSDDASDLTEATIAPGSKVSEIVQANGELKSEENSSILTRKDTSNGVQLKVKENNVVSNGATNVS